MSTIIKLILDPLCFSIHPKKNTLTIPVFTNKVSNNMKTVEPELYQISTTLMFVPAIIIQLLRKQLSQSQTWLESWKSRREILKKWLKFREVGCLQETRQSLTAWVAQPTISENRTSQLTTFKQVWTWTLGSRTSTQKTYLTTSSDTLDKTSLLPIIIPFVLDPDWLKVILNLFCSIFI